MSKVLHCICYPFCLCCPCLKSTTESKTKTKKKTKTKNRIKTVEKSEQQIDSENWEQKSKTHLTPNQIQDKHLTQVYRVPEDYSSEEQCLRDQGLEQMEIIGSGSSADVFKMKNKVDSSLMACKVMKTGEEGLGHEVKFADLKSELFIMIRAKRHENIIQVIRHFIIKNNSTKKEFCYICMQWANGGTIADKMAGYGIKDVRTGNRHKGLTEPKAKEYMRQIANGLQFLHSSGIAHKDLKLENLLIVRTDGKECIKITDFGLSRIGYNERTGTVIKENTNVGTIFYMSPQILKLHIYSECGFKVGKLKVYDPFIADCWALGVCLYAMVFAKFPFSYAEQTDEETLRQMYESMKRKDFIITDDFKANYSKECLDLIEQLLEPNVAKRLSVRLVLCHKWLLNK